MTKFMHLVPGDTALLVIDVQRALFTRPEPVYNASSMIETITNLIARAQLFGVRIVYVQHSNKTVLQKGSTGWLLHPGLKPTSRDLMIEKEQGDAFVGTALYGDFEARDIRNLLITGLVTNQCVRATSLGGVSRGYNVFLIQGGHSNFDRNPVGIIEKTEAQLEEAGVHVVPPEMLDFS